MRLAFWEKKTPALPTGSSPWDRWLTWARWLSLAAAAILLVATVVPLASDYSAPNAGGDISITVEFYTAFERGGGFISWDYSVAASQVLRGRLDFDHSGDVSASEMYGYTTALDAAITQDILVLRNFEIQAARIDTQSGIVAEPVNSTTPAHVRFTISGQWAQRDFDVTLGGDQLAELGFAGNLLPGMVVRERTIMIDGGLASLSGISGNAHIMRVPAGIMVVATGTWTNGSSNLPRVHFALFSPTENSLLLLIPMGVALFLGVGGARRERDATGQPRVERFHKALSAGFLLLIAAYFAAAPGVLIWIAGIGFAAGTLMMAYRVYPADKRPESWTPPRDLPKDVEGGDWAPVAAAPERATSGGAAMVDPIADAARGRTDPGPEPAPAQEPPTRDHTPRIFVSSAPKPAASEPPAPAVAAPAPASPAPTKVRCPGCKKMFEAMGTRPLHVACPHCGRRGVLR